ncbi:MAG: ammonium transporter [Roseinatronobacter sp.]
MQLKKILPLAALAVALPALGFAQDAETAVDAVAEVADIDLAAAVEALNTEMVFILNSLLFLIGGFLVFFMAAGFCMLETGLVRSKNAAMQATKNVALFSLAGIAYFIVGFNLMYPGDWIIEGWLGGTSPTVLEPVGVALEDVYDIEYASIGSDFIFQLMFCAATASIVSGAVAERVKLFPFLIFVAVLTGIIYPIQGSWSWGYGFLYEMGFSDFAGSSIVHGAGASAALAGALIIGARYGKYGKDGRVNVMPGSNLPLATLGMFILWLGWFGFNGGSQLAMGTIADVADVSRIFANTNLAASGGAIAALILTTVLYKKPDLTMVLNGALAGLVSITAEPLTPGLGAATLIGAVGGVIVVLTVPLLDKLKIDDVVGAIPVHGFAGIWGTLAVPLTNSDASFGVQIVGIALIYGFMFATSLVVWLILKATMGVRVSDEDQVTGLDKTEMGMEAYPEFSN